MTSFDALRVAERIETIAAAIYAAAAKQFSGDAAARSLFARLEAEELQHASRIRLLASQYRSDRKLVERFAGGEELQRCLQLAEAALAEATGAAWGAELAGVKHRLADLEAQLSTAHAHALSQDGHPALRDFFSQLALQDEAHARLLEP